MTEKLEYFSDERLMEFGESAYLYYEAQAKNSNVPPYFLDVAKAYLFNTPEMAVFEPKEVAKLLFNSEFESNRDAWIAINYAQAVAIVKQEADESFTGVDSKKMLVGVGVATMLEKDQEDDSVEAIKWRVEEIFSDPMEVLRVAKMYEELKIGSLVH